MYTNPDPVTAGAPTHEWPSGPGTLAPTPSGACVDPGARDLPGSFDAAMALDGNSSTVGCTAPNDIDVFVVSVPPGSGGHVVRFTVSGQQTMRPYVEILDANRKRAAHNTGGDQRAVQGWINVAGGTRAFIKVSQFGAVTDTYAVSLATSALTDADEPNDDPTHATALPQGQTISGFMRNPLNSPTSVPDWYRIDMGRSGELVVNINTVEGVAPNVVLYDGNRRLIRQQMGRESEMLKLQESVSRGVFFLVVDSLHELPAADMGEPPRWLTTPYSVSTAR